MKRLSHVLTLGNEKGGSGKSTTAVHIAVALAQMGLRVLAIDIDGRQKSMSRYIANRISYAKKNNLKLHIPDLITIKDSEKPGEDVEQLLDTLKTYETLADVVVIDCPGRDSPLSRMAHGKADTLITPMNDSFIDFDLLGEVDSDNMTVVKPSIYANLVWKSRKTKARESGRNIDWVVLRTRLSQIEARNMRNVGSALGDLAKRIGFRVIPGLSERVIFRELFPKGLTLLDLKNLPEFKNKISISHVAARQELRELIECLDLKFAQVIQMQKKQESQESDAKNANDNKVTRTEDISA